MWGCESGASHGSRVSRLEIGLAGGAVEELQRNGTQDSRHAYSRGDEPPSSAT